MDPLLDFVYWEDYFKIYHKIHPGVCPQRHERLGLISCSNFWCMDYVDLCQNIRVIKCFRRCTHSSELSGNLMAVILIGRRHLWKLGHCFLSAELAGIFMTCLTHQPHDWERLNSPQTKAATSKAGHTDELERPAYEDTHRVPFRKFQFLSAA